MRSLTPIRLQPGIGEPDAYILHDYLSQHSMTVSAQTVPPGIIWEALLMHASEPSDCARLADEARRRSLKRYALLFARRAGQAPGNTEALTHAGDQLMRLGKVDEAITWYEKAADAGDFSAAIQIGDILGEAKRSDEARSWYMRAAESGDELTRRFIAQKLRDSGASQEALLLYEQVAESGDTDAYWHGAAILRDAGQIDEAIEWYLRTEADATREIVKMLWNAGRKAKAIPYCVHAAERGDFEMRIVAFACMSESGQEEEAIDWLMSFSESEDFRWAHTILTMATRPWNMSEDVTIPFSTELISMYVALAANESADTASESADILRRLGHVDEALKLYERAARVDGTLASRDAADMLRDAGRIDEALTWYERAAEVPKSYAVGAAARMLREAGRVNEALTWYERNAQDSGLAFVQAADMLRDAGRIDEALTWYERTSRDPIACHHAADMLRYAGRVDEALSWYELGMGAGGFHTVVTVANMLHEAGRLQDALSWYERALDIGEDASALKGIVELLRSLGQYSLVRALLAKAAGASKNVYFVYSAAGMLSSIDPETAADLFRKVAFTPLRRSQTPTQMRQRREESAFRTDALNRAITLLRETGRTAEAIEWAIACAEAGNDGAIESASELLTSLNRADEAVAWLISLAESGRYGSLDAAVKLLHDTEQHEQAVRLKKFGIEPGGSIASE